MPSAPPDLLLGHTEPRLWTPPLRPLTEATSAGYGAIEFAEDILGLTLMPWQRWLLEHLLELMPDGTFRHRTALVLVARQQGKSTLAQVLALWRMYVDRAQLVIGTAQSLDLAEEVWAGAVEMAEGTADLAVEIDGVDRAAGKKTLRLSGGQRYKVQTANRRGGRGLSGDLVILDELREHTTWDAWGAVTKTTMARPKPQIVALSNAGDDASVVLNHLRESALKTITGDGDPRLGIFEWSAPEDCSLDDPAAWAQANPALGHTVTGDAIRSALGTDPPHVFRTEILCQRVESGVTSPLPLWSAGLDETVKATPGQTVAWAVDVSWDRTTAWIAAAAKRDDGRVHLELVRSGQGTEWVAPWIASRLDKWEPVAVAVQQSGAPVSSIVDELTTSLGSALVKPMSGIDIGSAAGQLYDAVATGQIVHPGQQPLTDAARLTAVRPLGDAWAFDRKKSTCDAAPLCAAAAALWALQQHRPAPKRRPPQRLR